MIASHRPVNIHVSFHFPSLIAQLVPPPSSHDRGERLVIFSTTRLSSMLVVWLASSSPLTLPHSPWRPEDHPRLIAVNFSLLPIENAATTCPSLHAWSGLLLIFASVTVHK